MSGVDVKLLPGVLPIAWLPSRVDSSPLLMTDTEAVFQLQLRMETDGSNIGIHCMRLQSKLQKSMDSMHIIPNGHDYVTFHCGRTQRCNVMTATQDF
jgi:hypothetical protein